MPPPAALDGYMGRHSVAIVFIVAVCSVAFLSCSSKTPTTPTPPTTPRSPGTSSAPNRDQPCPNTPCQSDLRITSMGISDMGQGPSGDWLYQANLFLHEG